MVLSLCLWQEGRHVSVCVCCQSAHKCALVAFPSLGPRVEASRNTWPCKKKHARCFHVHSVLPVLGTVVGAMFVKIKKPQKAGRVPAFESVSLQGTYLCFFLRDCFGSPPWEVAFLHCFTLNCHLKSTFIFLMPPLNSSFRFFYVCLESSDIRARATLFKDMCWKSVPTKPFHLMLQI